MMTKEDLQISSNILMMMKLIIIWEFHGASINGGYMGVPQKWMVYNVRTIIFQETPQLAS